LSTIKLFKTKNSSAIELNVQSIAVEKSLQTTIEHNLELFLGVKFLASEYSTGKTHGGRIDTLGIDENNAPVIIEYKRSINENVINQGLFYLDWLLDHKGEFTLLAMNKIGKINQNNIEWNNARLLCIASEFTKYDEYAVQQINRNIELIRYRKFDDDIMLFELVNAVSAEPETRHGGGGRQNTVLEAYEKMGSAEKDWYETLKAYIFALGDDVQEKSTKLYIAFKRLSNFACFEFHPSNKEIVVFLKLDPATIQMEHGFTRDVTHIGHYGTGDLEVTINSEDDVKKVQTLISQAYDES
jgi:predicted transport protein